MSECLQAIKNRRAVRRYRPDPVPDELLDDAAPENGVGEEEPEA